MHLDPGRLSDMVHQARARERFIICHDSLPQVHPGYGPAVCRGFYDRYDTQALQLARRLWGIVEVRPPPAGAVPAHEQTAPTGAVPACTRAVPPQRPPATRAFVSVDGDGVLNPAGVSARTRGYRPHPFARTGRGENATGAVVWLHPDHGAWLAELETVGARLVWATSWNHLANTRIAPRIGLPGTWPVVDRHGRGGVRWGHALKLDPVAAYAADTPFVLLDDQIGGKDPDWAAQRTANGRTDIVGGSRPVHGADPRRHRPGPRLARRPGAAYRRPAHAGPRLSDQFYPAEERAQIPPPGTRADDTQPGWSTVAASGREPNPTFRTPTKGRRIS